MFSVGCVCANDQMILQLYIVARTAIANTTSVPGRLQLASVACLGTNTSMSFQHLQYLTGLQVPDINFGIFTSAYYVFPLGSAKTGNEAIGTVGVSSICLHTARCVIIPQANGRILSGCEHKFRIGRKLDMRTRMEDHRHCVETSNYCSGYTNQIGLSSSTRVFKHWPESASQIRLLTTQLQKHRRER